MNKLDIVKNLNQIQQLLEEDSPYILKERIKWLISDIEKDYIISEDDIKYRQGRSKRQQQSNEQLMMVSSLGLFLTLVGIVICNNRWVTLIESRSSSGS